MKPVVTISKLDVDGPGPMVNETMYIGVIGSLSYLTTRRSNIVFSMEMSTKFQAFPKETHLKDTNRILRYLNRTGDLVLFYPSNDSFDLIGYVDADYVG